MTIIRGRPIFIMISQLLLKHGHHEDLRAPKEHPQDQSLLNHYLTDQLNLHVSVQEA